MSLFKYQPKEYVKGFFSKGNLKIGTLYEYRKIEIYGNAIGDDAEGIISTDFELPNGGTIHMGQDSREAEFLRSIPGLSELPSGVKIVMAKGAKIIDQNHSPDAYIFCTTAEFDPNVMKEFGGACFEIVQPEKFFKIISRAIRHQAILVGTAPITYRSRQTDWERPHTVHGSMIKADKYAYQKEVRTLWNPLKESVKPLFIKVPDAIKYCRPMNNFK